MRGDIPKRGGGFACVLLAALLPFVSLRQTDGRWTLVGTNGLPFAIRGVDHATYAGFRDARTKRYAHREANDRRFAGDREAWARETSARLKAWGFNTLGSGCERILRGRGLYHTAFLPIGSFRRDPSCRIPPKFPNVFHPDWERFCDETARATCLPLRDDPALIGYFFGNELAWWGDGRGGAWKYGLFHSAASLPDTHSAKRALLGFTGGTTNVPDAVKAAFVRRTAERYFATVTAAIRRYDPNHLVLGCRFMGVPHGAALPEVWTVCGHYCDVASVNIYPHVNLATGAVMNGRRADAPPLREVCEQVHAWTHKPLFITEWSFVARDAGLPCTTGCGTRYVTQTERAHATAAFLRAMAEWPFLVGSDFFMWVDEPPGGLDGGAEGENCNYGLVNEAGVPYGELIRAFQGTTAR